MTVGTKMSNVEELHGALQPYDLLPQRTCQRPTPNLILIARTPSSTPATPYNPPPPHQAGALSPMYEQLVTRIAEQLALPRPIKAQTQRQLSRHCSDESTETAKFLLSATDLLEEDELDIVFAAQFTPDCDDQIAVSELLYHWRPSEEEISRITDDACRHTHHAIVVLPGEVEAPLPLHEVMADRFIRLLALQRAPEPRVSAALREVLPSSMWALGTALLRQRGFEATRQSWFVAFIEHMVRRHPVDEALLAATAEFVAAAPGIDPATLLRSAGEQLKAARGLVANARGGRTYWSADVAQHHHYRGQGEVDQNLLKHRQEEEQWLRLIELDLQHFDPDGDA